MNLIPLYRTFLILFPLEGDDGVLLTAVKVIVMRSVDEICSMLDGCADDITRSAHMLSDALRSPRNNGLRTSLLRSKLEFCISKCGYAFHEWQLQKEPGRDDVRWRMYNDRFVALFERCYPKALDEISLRYAA